MPKLKPGTIKPTPAEDKAINAGIAADADTLELTEQHARQLRRMPGRPRQTVTKEAVALRLDPEVLAYFRATGKGWQTRLNQVLKDWVRHHPQR